MRWPCTWRAARDAFLAAATECGFSAARFLAVIQVAPHNDSGLSVVVVRDQDGAVLIGDRWRIVAELNAARAAALTIKTAAGKVEFAIE